MLSALSSAPASAYAGLRADTLRANDMTNPLGVDDRRPTLSWRLRSDVRGDRQTAYQVLVASRAESLSEPDVWDSGKVMADTIAIPYAGPDLKPGQRYFWTVRTWDARG